MANDDSDFWRFEDLSAGGDDDEALCFDVDSLMCTLDESLGPSQDGIGEYSSSIVCRGASASDGGVSEHTLLQSGFRGLEAVASRIPDEPKLFPFSTAYVSEAPDSRVLGSDIFFEPGRNLVNFDQSMGESSSVTGYFNTALGREVPPCIQIDPQKTQLEAAESNGTFGFADGDGVHQKSGVAFGTYCDTGESSHGPLEIYGTDETSASDFGGFSDCLGNTCDRYTLQDVARGDVILPCSFSHSKQPFDDFGSQFVSCSSQTMTSFKPEQEDPLIPNSCVNRVVNGNSDSGGLFSLGSKSCERLKASTHALPCAPLNMQGRMDWQSVRGEKTVALDSFEGTADADGGSGKGREIASQIEAHFLTNSSSSKDAVAVKGIEEDGFIYHSFDLIDETHRTIDHHMDSHTATMKQLICIKQQRDSGVGASRIMDSFDQNDALTHRSHVVDDDTDVCILEDVSDSSCRNRSSEEGKSIAPVLCSSFSAPQNPSGLRLKTNDERFVFRAALLDLSQPKLEASPPDGALLVPLLRHQRIALSWMVQKETNSLYCSGGILADDQGLGKTISTIALILKERPPPSLCFNETKTEETETLNLDDDDDGVTELDGSKPNRESCQVMTIENSTKRMNSPVQAKGRPAAGTLVVCPTSVLRQWSDELHNKVSNDANLSVLVYHGGSRTKDPLELASYDVVLTTYAIVSMEVPKQPIVDESDDDTRRKDHFLRVELSSCKKRKYPPSSNRRYSKGKKGIDGELFESDARPLARVGWFRVILDEAQSIKNHRTQVARACWGLRAKRRWCLSGTPIQNAIDDLYSYFRFLKYDPYDVYKSFCSKIKVPVQKNPTNGYKKLQAILKAIMLRRTKGTLLDGQPIVNLPPKTIQLKKVDFTSEERDFYSRLETESREQFQEYAAAGTVKQNYVNILLMLLRLRQACDHPLLVSGCSSNSERRSSLDSAKKLPEEKQVRLLNCLEASLAICNFCHDPPEDAVVTSCEHVFCNQCILEHLSSDDNQCPSKNCKSRLTLSSVFSSVTLKQSLRNSQPCQNNNSDSSCTTSDRSLELVSFDESSDSSKGKAFKALVPFSFDGSFDSSKIKAALELLQSISRPRDLASSSGYSSVGPTEDKSLDVLSGDNGDENCKRISVVGEKAIVFSQWTRMLDLLETCLKNSSINYRRLDGTMSIAARDKAVKDFNMLPEVSVMIMSLKAASLGLNMVAACHVLLLDLWWNPTTEDQAIDRAHRIGQTRPVTVLRLTVKDTVEDRILALQQKKRKMVSSAFGEDETGSHGTRLTVDDLKYLFMV